MKLGKLPAKHDPRTLKMAAYLAPQDLPPIPPYFHWGAAVQSWPMMGNNDFGNCTIATAGHMIQCWTANAGKTEVIPDAKIISAYLSMTGGTDSGLMELDVLNYWRRTGICGHKISAYVGLDEKRVDQIKAAVYLFGGAYIGLMLPLSAQNQVGTVWQGGKGPDAVAGSWGGHAVNVVGFMPDGLICVTWGQEQIMTWKFWERYCDESYALLSPDFIKPGGKAPHGFDLARLRADLRKLEG